MPLGAITVHLRELRGQVEQIAARFPEFTTEHVFARHLDGPRRPTEADASEAASLVLRPRPLARQTVDAELARAMRLFAGHHLRRRLGAGDPATPVGERTVPVPVETMRAVERLVGPEQGADFFARGRTRGARPGLGRSGLKSWGVR